jgi:hypothetical protein
VIRIREVAQTVRFTSSSHPEAASSDLMKTYGAMIKSKELTTAGGNAFLDTATATKRSS